MDKKIKSQINREELSKLSSSLFLQTDSLLENYLNSVQQEGIWDNVKRGARYIKKGAETISQNSSLIQQAPILGVGLGVPGSTEALGLSFFTYNYMKNILSQYAVECKKQYGQQGMSAVSNCIDAARKKMFLERIKRLEIIKNKCRKIKWSNNCLQKVDELQNNLEEKIKNIKVLIF